MKYEKLHISAKLYVQVGAHLGVPELVEFPISSARANFEENGIPFCTVTVATGRDASNPSSILGLSPFHWKEKLLRLPSRAVLRLRVIRVDQVGPSNQEWPRGWFTAFEGWVSDVIPEVSIGNRGATLRLTHWLSDLDFSSPYTEDALPGSPEDFLFNATTFTGTGLVSSIVGGATFSKALANFTPQTVMTDIWEDGFGGGIRPFLYGISAERLFNWQQIANFSGSAAQGANDPPRTNSLMTEALDNFEPKEDPVTGFKSYTYGVPLQLRDDIISSGELANKIQRCVSQAFYSPHALGSTIWDKLSSGLSSFLMFSLVPMVDRVLTVPYSPWLNQTWTRIATDEFDSLSYSSTVRRPIKGVAVIGGYSSSTGLKPLQQTSSTIVNNRGVLGYYEPTPSPTNGTKNGMTMYVSPPAWLNDLLMQGFSSRTAPTTGNIPFSSAPIPRNLDPFNPFLGPVIDAIEKEMLDKKKAAESLANALAKATYLQNATQMRQAVISTNLRFDIAPGSMLLIQSSPDMFVEAALRTQGMTDTDLVGRVARVTWSIDIQGESASASTVFHIAYLRTLEENGDEAYASDEHPLWRYTWTGSPLIAMREFSQ